MVTIRIGILVLLGLILGCSTTSKDILPLRTDFLPPNVKLEATEPRQIDSEIQKLVQGDPRRAIVWWGDYKRAMLWRESHPEQACEYFTRLKNDGLFPLRSVAGWRALATCKPSSDQLSVVETIANDWQQELALDAALKAATLLNDHKRQALIAIELAKQETQQRQKIFWLEKASKNARIYGDAELKQMILTRLYQVAPRRNPDPKIDDYLQVANDFRLAREFRSAHKYYQKILSTNTPDFDTQLSALKGVRLAYKNARQLEKHLQASQRLVKFVETSYLNRWNSKDMKSQLLRHLHEAKVSYARALWTQGHVAQAQKVLTGLERQIQKSMPLTEIYLLRGRIAEESKNYHESLTWYERASREANGGNESQDRLLWSQGWLYRKLKEYRQAAKFFAQGQTNTTADFVRARFSYWLARTLEDAGMKSEAQLEFEKLTVIDPQGYYGLLARRQRQMPISLSNAVRSPASLNESFGVVIAPQLTSALGPLVNAEILAWLLVVETPELGIKYLHEIARAFRKSNSQDVDSWVQIFKYFTHLDAYHKVFEHMSTLSAELRESLLNKHPEFIFPQPWRSLVDNAAQQSQIPSELIYSIMRQESAFNTYARSTADAFGLMQILPEVAQRLSTRPISTDPKQTLTRFKLQHPEDLFEPDVNIPIGAAHMKELLAKYDNQFILAVAAYNANEQAIRGWLKTRYNGNPIEFIEEIPYEETRSYVRLVMRNFVFYSLLNSGSTSLPFPEQVLEIKGAPHFF